MIKASIDLQDLRRRIYLKAKTERSWRFWGLYVHVCKMETLHEAYVLAKANKGAPGSDGVTFAAIEAQGVEVFLKQIQGELTGRRYKRAGMETRLLIEGADGSARKSPDRSLLRHLSQAHRFHEMVMHSRGRTMAELAIEAGVGGSYFTRILRLSFLAPEVVKTILRDRHPLELTAKKLAGDTRLPIAWEEQRARLGIA